MREINKNVWVESDDTEILSFMDHMRQKGVPIPVFDPKSEVDQFLFAVTYTDCFNLYVIAYSPKAGDSGYTLLHIRNFLTENLFNLKKWAWMGFDVSAALASIHTQVAGIADKINYPLTIMTAFDDDFTGLIATPMINAN